jgi:tellurite methyltransferase
MSALPLSPRDGEALLDVRSPPDYARRHLVDAVNIPLEELPGRIHELPPKTTPIDVFDVLADRARTAAELLSARGRRMGHVLHGDYLLDLEPTSSGPNAKRLWQPHPWLAAAMDTARESWGGLTGRRALEVACGSGRDAVYLALCGLSVQAWDILPDAIVRCGHLAARSGVTVAATVCDARRVTTLGSTPYDLVSCFYFLHRPLMPTLAAAVAPGGFLVYETFVAPQKELFGKPAREADVLKPGELRQWFSGWDVVQYEEGIVEPRRCSARLIARKPGSSER